MVLASATADASGPTPPGAKVPSVYRAPVTAELSEPDRPLASAAESRLAQAFADLDVGASPSPDTCSDTACWNARALDAGATYLVEVRIDDAGPDKQVVLEVTEVHSRDVVISLRETCELCGRDELADLVGDVAANAARRIERQELVTTVLRVRSNPANARVFIDGVDVGPASADHPITPGPHEVRVELEGYVPTTRGDEAQRGSVAELRVQLSPRPESTGGSAAATNSRPMVIGGAVATAVGLAAVGASAVMLALHGRPIKGECGGADVDGDGDCRFLHNTRTGGAVLLGAGIAAAVSGAVLLGVGLRRRHSERGRRATLRPDGLGIEARF